MAYKKKGKSKKKVWTAEEKAQWLEDKKEKELANALTIENSLIAFFEEGAKATRENYIHSNALNVPPSKIVFSNKKGFDLVEFKTSELAQLDRDPLTGERVEINIPVLATFPQMKKFFEYIKDDLVLENAKKGFDPENPMKGQKTKAVVMSSIFSCYDKENGKSLLGADAFKRIKELEKKGLSSVEIDEILVNKKNISKANNYFSLDDFADIIPEHIKELIPQIAMQQAIKERKMDTERMNLDAAVDAMIIKKAMVDEYEQISFVEKELNVAYCATALNKEYSIVNMASPEKYKSHAHYLSVMCHEFGHSTQAIDKRSLGTKVDGVNHLEEAVVELATSKMTKTLGYDYMMEDHAAYIIENIGKDTKQLLKASKAADRVYSTIKSAYDKHNTPELRLEMENKVKEDIANKYGQEAKQELENTKGNKRSGQRLRA